MRRVDANASRLLAVQAAVRGWHGCWRCVELLTALVPFRSDVGAVRARILKAMVAIS